MSKKADLTADRINNSQTFTRFGKIVLAIGGALFIISGVLFFFFLLALNDPEVEGESGRIRVGTYFLSLIPITIGVIMLFVGKQKINKF